MNEGIRRKLRYIHDTIYGHRTKAGLDLIKQLINEKDETEIDVAVGYKLITNGEYTALKVYRDHHIQAIDAAQWIRKFSDELGLSMTDDLSINGVARLERSYRMLLEKVKNMKEQEAESPWQTEIDRLAAVTKETTMELAGLVDRLDERLRKLEGRKESPEGMSLRDYFAGQALSNPEVTSQRGDFSGVANMCYWHADALLEAGESKPKAKEKSLRIGKIEHVHLRQEGNPEVEVKEEES